MFFANSVNKSVLEMGPSEIKALQEAQLARVRLAAAHGLRDLRRRLRAHLLHGRLRSAPLELLLHVEQVVHVIDLMVRTGNLLNTIWNVNYAF